MLRPIVSSPRAVSAKPWAGGINDSQQVVGWTDLSGKQVGFVLFNNNFAFISAPGRTITQAFGINNSGDIVGYYQGLDGIEYGFLRSR
jgi:hypothetical protein